MASAAPNGTVCVTFRYPDGSREYVYLESLPTGGERISRHGTDYTVRSIDTDGAGNTMVTLQRVPPEMTKAPETELSAMRPAGIEPATSGSGGQRSIP
jgi:hypothetical protein